MKKCVEKSEFWIVKSLLTFRFMLSPTLDKDTIIRSQLFSLKNVSQIISSAHCENLQASLL